ncbi:TPA: hypothetical protein U2C23_000398 [Streptococcus suis]|nr:hypothetical protein [Streptococcus suis]
MGVGKNQTSLKRVHQQLFNLSCWVETVPQKPMMTIKDWSWPLLEFIGYEKEKQVPQLLMIIHEQG